MGMRRLAIAAAATMALSCLATAPASAAQCSDRNPLTAAYLARWEQRYRASHYQIAVYDVERDCTFRASTHAGSLPTASTVKVMIAVGILEQVAAGQIPYSQVRSDLSAMIRVSSNASAQRLYRRMGRAAEINDLADRYGMGKTKPGRKWGVTKTTADDQVLLLRRALLDDPPTLPAVQQRRLLRLMRKVAREQRWGAGYGLPPGWTAAVKNGWYHTVPGDEPPINRSRVNTTGIVFDAQGKPRWVIAGFSNRWRTDRAGIRAWNALSKHVARVLAD